MGGYDRLAVARIFFFPALGGLLFGYDIGATSYVLNNTFELPEPPVVVTDGIFAIWWAPQFDHTDDAPIMFEQFNAVRDDCLLNLGMRDPPNLSGRHLQKYSRALCIPFR